jgi:formate hydrogenlyase subunit 6/NADH:ubiquinone oxidoreductase subunit I
MKKKCIKRTEDVDFGRRKMLTITGAIVASTAIKAEGMNVENGLAFIEDKKIPVRHTQLIPFGAVSYSNFTKKCTACQKCIEACPEKVLRPSSKLTTLMIPEISFEHGYCKPDCTRCSDVCPEGAILPITTAEKSSIQIGHAVWIKKNCLITANGKECNVCARRCPTGAIIMAKVENSESNKIPMINTAHCIGCGACENSCPAQPFCAIYVEGHQIHHTI